MSGPPGILPHKLNRSINCSQLNFFCSAEEDGESSCSEMLEVEGGEGGEGEAELQDWKKQRAHQLGFTPQKENGYNKLLPYAEHLDTESARWFGEIKVKIIEYAQQLLTTNYTGGAGARCSAAGAAPRPRHLGRQAQQVPQAVRAEVPPGGPRGAGPTALQSCHPTRSRTGARQPGAVLYCSPVTD